MGLISLRQSYKFIHAGDLLSHFTLSIYILQERLSYAKLDGEVFKLQVNEELHLPPKS